MTENKFLKKEAKEIKEILGRIKRKNLKGNSGQAIKNSTYQIITTFIAKIGSLFFTIIITRLMLPEIYGLYGLALSTILFLGIFSDMGIGAAINTFVSKNIDKKPGKAKSYLYYLTKWKIVLIGFSISIIILLSNWVATNYYQKPIYYALLAGTIYFPIIILASYLASIFKSTNNFKPILIQEIIFQILGLTVVPLSIIFFLSKIKSIEIYLFWIFIILAICYLIASTYLYYIIKKDKPFKKSQIKKLSKTEKNNLIKFILPLTVTALSGIFFGHIDKIMLGSFVAGEYIGFYSAAFLLVTSLSTIISFSSSAIFPIFARLNGKKLEKGFKKSKNITILISIPTLILTFFFSKIIIRILYPPLYLQSTTYLRILSLSLISYPLILLYSAYYISQKRTKIISILLVSSTILNIVLNYILISIGLRYSMSYAVMGACSATIISRFGYLGGLILFRKNIK